MYKYIILCFIVFYCFLSTNKVKASEGDSKMITDSIEKQVQDIDRYRNTSTAGSYIKIVLKDFMTEERLNIVIINTVFIDFLAKEEGIEVYDKKGRFIINSEEYNKFVNDKYIMYMSKNIGKEIVVSVNNFKKFIGDKCLKECVYDSPMKLNELEVEDEKQVLDKYFDFNYKEGSGMLKHEFHRKFANNPSFIALLLNLGYDVVMGDYAPILSIYTKPFSSHFKEK